jgi:hypothetical protein
MFGLALLTFTKVSCFVRFFVNVSPIASADATSLMPSRPCGRAKHGKSE